MTRGPSATHDAAAASHERETFRAIARSDREWDQILGPLRGWEPTFLWMVDGWAEVRVDVVTRSTLSGGPTERRVVVERRDGRTHGWEREPAGDEHEWLLAAPDRWVRRGGKPWTRTALEPTRTLAQLSASVPTLMQSLWEALPVAATEPLAGTRQVRCVRWRGAGHLVWEVDLGRRVVTRVRATDALGQHAWEETRSYEERAGRVLLTERRRRMADGREEVETSVWHTGPGSVSPSAVALPPP